MDALHTPHHDLFLTDRPRKRIGFSITELLVVIGIIVLLAGLLVVAMGKVRESSLRTSTLSTMQNFGRAADAFQMEHGFYPGVIPEHVLARAIDENQITVTKGPTGFTGQKWLSGTENALLHMMGGYRVCAPGTPGCSKAPGTPSGKSPIGQDFLDFDVGPTGYEITIGQAEWQWLLKVDVNQVGQGPFINGKPYAPYYTPSPNEVYAVRGQAEDAGLPDLVDAWGMPVLYTRRIRNSGPLVGEPNPGKGQQRPQFVIDGMKPYLESTGLGDRGLDQMANSIFNLAPGDPHGVFAQIIRHPSFGTWDKGPFHDANLGRITPRGEYVLISAGPDGIYFSKYDGPGDEDIVNDPDFAKPQVIDSYDDIVTFGGG